MPDVFEEVEAETYRELQVVQDIDIGPDHVAMRDPKSGELFAVERASVAPPGVMFGQPSTDARPTTSAR